MNGIFKLDGKTTFFRKHLLCFYSSIGLLVRGQDVFDLIIKKAVSTVLSSPDGNHMLAIQ